jgi:hypothetical protein
MTTGSTATIISVGKPLPQSLVGQQVEIVRFISPSFPAVRTTDGREYIMDISHLDCSVKSISLSKQWIEAGIRHHRCYARWLLGVHGAYQRSSREFENKDKYLATLKREAKRLLEEARKLEAKLC